MSLLNSQKARLKYAVYTEPTVHNLLKDCDKVSYSQGTTDDKSEDIWYSVLLALTHFTPLSLNHGLDDFEVFALFKYCYFNFDISNIISNVIQGRYIPVSTVYLNLKKKRSNI